MDTLRGIFPQPKGPPKRDFLKENVMKIKKASIKNRDQVKQQEKSKELRIKTIKKPPNCFNTESSETIISCNGSCNRSRPESQQSNQTVLTDQGIQTVEDLNSEAFLKDSIIKYPSNTKINDGTAINEPTLVEMSGAGDSNTNTNAHIKNLREFLDTGSITKKSMISEPNSHRSGYNSYRTDHRTPKSPKFVMPSNIMSARSEAASSQFNASYGNTNSVPLSPTSTIDTMTTNFSKLKKARGDTDSNKSEVPSNYKKGEIPKYLQDRNKNIIKEQERLREIDPDCPPDHVALSEDERKETLDLAEKKFQSLIDELNKMPMTADTLKIRRRKIEIEKELDTLESTIRIFSRQKVYVKINE